jgi:hypothetical protein
MQAVQACKVDVSPIHNVERSGLEQQLIENANIGHFPGRHVDKTGNRPPQVEQRVQLDRALVAAKLGPRKQTQTEIDGRRVERVNRLRELDGQRIVSVKLTGAADQDLSKVGVNPPVVRAIGVGQCAPRNLSPKPRVIELRSQCSQASFDVAQAFAKRQLSVRQTQELIATRESAWPSPAAVLVDARFELAARQETQELGKDELTIEHKPSSATLAGINRRRQGSSLHSISDRVHALRNATRWNT